MWLGVCGGRPGKQVQKGKGGKDESLKRMHNDSTRSALPGYLPPMGMVGGEAESLSLGENLVLWKKDDGMRNWKKKRGGGWQESRKMSPDRTEDRKKLNGKSGEMPSSKRANLGNSRLLPYAGGGAGDRLERAEEREERRGRGGKRQKEYGSERGHAFKPVIVTCC